MKIKAGLPAAQNHQLLWGPRPEVRFKAGLW